MGARRSDAAPSRPPLPRWVLRRPPLIGSRQRFDRAKRVIDVGVVLALAPFWFFALVVIVVLVWLSSPGGPVLYRQPRTGRGGQRFDMWKLRTMVVGAHDVAQTELVPHVDQGPQPKPDHDPRVTPIGRWLRRTSLDELPQLWNVLRGEMSLVGPRPTSFAAETYRPWHRRRLEIVPGMTGLWQVVARGTTDFDLRVAYDLEYLDRRSTRLDLAILARTVPAVLFARGAR